MVTSILDEFEELKIALRVPHELFHRVNEQDASEVIEHIKSCYVKNVNVGWWWESFGFRAAKIRFLNSDGHKVLTTLIPESANLHWLIVDDGNDQIVYEGTADSFQKIIANSAWIREYYILPKDKEWLIGYSHHDLLYAVGEPVESAVHLLGTVDS